MVNNRYRQLLNIFLLFTCLTFLFFLISEPLFCAELPPLDSGNLPFAPLPGAYPPQSGGFFSQFGAPYGFPYQNPGPGFMPMAGQYGLPYQSPMFGGMPGGFMPTGTPYGFPAQTPLYNMPTSFPYGPINPNLQLSSNTSGTNGNLPVYDTIYNQGSFPSQGFYGPVQNMLAPTALPQQLPNLSPYNPGFAPGFMDPRAGFANPFVNPFAGPFGNMPQLQGAFPQRGYMGLPFQGFNPLQPVNPWQQPWSPYGTNFNPYSPYNPNPYPYPYDPYPDYDDDGDDDDKPTPVELPNAKGEWAGTWEAWLTDPNEGLLTDSNDQIIVIMSGDIRFHITEQDSSGGTLLGTIKIKGWDVDPQPQDWPGNWTGESDEVILTGWVDAATRYLKARYYYYPGHESSGNYNEDESYKNIKGLYTWMFNTNKLKITETGISGQFNITGTEGYYVIGVFSTAKYVPQ